MLDYVAKLTLTPSEVSRDDVQALREAGFDDRAILDIAQITAYFAFVNRTADGLGVTMEEFWQKRPTSGDGGAQADHQRSYRTNSERGLRSLADG